MDKKDDFNSEFDIRLLTPVVATAPEEPQIITVEGQLLVGQHIICGEQTLKPYRLIGRTETTSTAQIVAIPYSRSTKYIPAGTTIKDYSPEAKMLKDYAPEDIHLDQKHYDFLLKMLGLFNEREMGIAGCGDCGSPWLVTEKDNSVTHVCYNEESRSLSFNIGEYGNDYTLLGNGVIKKGRRSESH